eukprot:gene17150-biopygen14757
MSNLNRRNVHVIANSSEKIVTASIESVNNSNGHDDDDDGGNGDWVPGGIRYVDSFAFLSRGLAELANNVPDNESTLVNEYPRRTWNNVDFDEGFRLLRRKGVYPYDWVDSVEKMDVTSLPSQEEFYNELNDCGINDDDYEHAQKVWQFFRCNTFKDYHELYLVTDVLPLANVFESFRKLGMEYYGLDPAWYISLPAFAWDAMLKMTDIKLELLTEEKKDIYLLLEKCIQGGISIVMQRHAETTEQSSIIYKDANNLHGHAMSQDLPTDGFRLLSSKEIQRCDVHQMFARGDRTKGYIFRVDLEYPPELHDRHADLPLAPERVKVKEEGLSPLQKEMQTMENVRNHRKFDICTRDLSKEHAMYDYHYNYVKHAFPNAKLCYMDTDSFIYDIPRPLEEVHQIMNESSHLFDFSYYPKDHRNYSTTNKKVIGKMKDELEGKVMDEFIGLQPKMYSCKIAGGNLIKKAKGIKKRVVRKQINHQDYQQCLTMHRVFVHEQCNIISKNQMTYSVRQKKTSLTPFDERYILEDGIHSLPYGHHRLQSEE